MRGTIIVVAAAAAPGMAAFTVGAMAAGHSGAGSGPGGGRPRRRWSAFCWPLSGGDGHHAGGSWRLPARVRARWP